MNIAFSFFLRLFLCFVAAKFLLQAIGVVGRGYLVGLTVVFLANTYWFSYLVFREQTAARSPKDRGPVRSPAKVEGEGEVSPEKPAPEK
jgi:hypothetical protein